MMQSSAAFALAAASASALGQAAKPADHSQHQGGKYAPLAASAADCVRIGQVSLAHCFAVLGQGDKAMAICAISTNEMLAACDTLLTLVAGDSKYLPKMPALGVVVLEDCEKECRGYEKQHKAMKESADACAVCAKECRKVAA